MNIDRPLESVCIFAPAAVHQSIASERSPRLSQQRPQQPELGRRQLQIHAVRVGDVIDPIDLDPG